MSFVRRGPADRSPTQTAIVKVGVVIAALVAVVAVAAWVQLQRAVADLDDARATIAEAERFARDGDIDAVIESITSAERSLSSARATLRSSAPLRLARAIPGLGHNIDAAQTITDRAFDLAASARRISDVTRPLTEDGFFGPDGSVDTDAITRIREVAASVRRDVDELEPLELPSSWLLASQVSDAGVELAEGERSYGAIVASIDDGLALVERLTGADAPSRWLIVAANAAEMRGAGGMPLSYAVLTGSDGVVEVSEIGHDEDLNARLVGGVDVDLPDDYRVRYERYNLTADIRNATLSADFGVGGPILAAMFEHATGTAVDGVVQVDSMALADLLAVTGPVHVDGVGELNQDTIVDVTLDEIYASFDAQTQRQDALATVAGTIVEHLFASEPRPLDLLDALGDAVAGRHLMISAADPDVAAAVAALGADGTFGHRADVVHLAVENFAGNKLDYVVDTALTLGGTWRPDGAVTATITVANGAVPGVAEPAYVYGPADPSLVAGQYRGHVVLYLPAGTEVVAAPEGAGVSDVVVGTENGRPVVTFAVDVLAGDVVHADVELAFDTEGCPSLDLVPSPRIRPVDVDVDIDTPDGPLRRTGPLQETVTLTADC